MSHLSKNRVSDADVVAFYRTQWLMAHNCLHDLVHKGGDPQVAFDSYLRDLATANEIAMQPA